MKFKTIKVYYDLESGKYHTESEFNRITKEMPALEITMRFIPIVKGYRGVA
jgi:hypothetical protein